MRNFTRKAGLWPVLVLTLILLSSWPADSQTIPKKPCLEHFTASTCPPCASFNPVFNALLADYPGQYTLIRYQMYWPGTGDPYYFAESKKRRDYYSITGVPGLTKNGQKQLPYAQFFSKAIMDSLLNIKTGVALSINGTISNDKIVTANVTMTPEIAYAAGLKLLIVVMEETTTQNAATNGEKSFEFVTMGFLPDATGITLGALTPGTPVTVSHSIDMKTTHMETSNDLIVAAFIQNETDKQVLQSENARVSHSFTEFKINLTVIDNDYNPVPGGALFAPYIGEKKIPSDGLCVIPGVTPGVYDYEVTAPGYMGTEGTITITDSDFNGEIMLEKPDLFFYEDFNSNQVPEGWNISTTNNNMIYATMSGTLLFYKPYAGDDENYLILPPTGLAQPGVFSFRAGMQSGSPVAKVGIVTTIPVVGTDGIAVIEVTGFNEVGSFTITKADGFIGYSVRLAEGIGDQRLAFKFVGDPNDWAEIDQVMIIEENPGVKVAFWVTDQDDQPLDFSAITFSNKELATNAYGYATYRDTDPGNYNYSVTYKGEEIASGQLEVDGEIIKHIKHNTSGIEDMVEEIPVSVFPNPVKDHFVISGIQTANLSIITMSGQVLMQKSVRDGEAIQVGTLQKGLYLVKIECEEETVYCKILVTR